jgi:hypothetical protein
MEEQKKVVEVKYEIQLGKLLGIALLAVGLAILLGFFIGNSYGYTKGFSQVSVEKPAYCTADVSAGIVKIKCNELGNVSMKDFCNWASPDLKEKVKLVLIT